MKFIDMLKKHLHISTKTVIYSRADSPSARVAGGFSKHLPLY